MNIDHEIQSLHEKLNNLAPWQAAVFSACCAERLLPNYAFFSREVGWGDAGLLRRLLDFCWHTISHATEGEIDFELNIRLCDSITPDMDDFDVPSKSMALDAALAVRFTLECLETKRNEAKSASRFALDTVDSHLGWQAIESNLEFEDEMTFIKSHPLWLQEIKAQFEIVDLLTKYQDNPKRACEVTRIRCFNQGIGNLGYSEL